MTKKNITRRPVRCPNCQAKISSLYYAEHKVFRGEYTLDEGYQEDYDDDDKLDEGTEYYCPKCHEDLFDNQAHATAFLRGKKARPILLERNRAENAADGK
jgi:hypothetical protein